MCTLNFSSEAYFDNDFLYNLQFLMTLFPVQISRPVHPQSRRQAVCHGHALPG